MIVLRFFRLAFLSTAGALPLEAQQPPVSIQLLARGPVEGATGADVAVTVQARNLTDSTVRFALILEWPSPVVFLTLRDSAFGPMPDARGMDYPDWHPGRDLIRRHLLHLKPGGIWTGQLAVGGDSTTTRGFVLDRSGTYFLSGVLTVFGEDGNTVWHVATDTLRLLVTR